MARSARVAACEPGEEKGEPAAAVTIRLCLKFKLKHVLAHPSALDTKVHALVKAEVSALDTKVGALHDRLSALEAKVESKLDAIIARLSR